MYLCMLQEQPPAIPGADETWASPEGAEKRANLGSNYQNLGQMQAFDGPAPETINGKFVGWKGIYFDNYTLYA